MANRGRRRGRSGTYGETNGSAKLRWPDIKTILARLASGESQRSIALAFAVNRTTIARIANGVGWRKR
jgi:DNA invertase Pin-like site-specific DNA recombinase